PVVSQIANIIYRYLLPPSCQFSKPIWFNLSPTGILDDATIWSFLPFRQLHNRNIHFFKPNRLQLFHQPIQPTHCIWLTTYPNPNRLAALSPSQQYSIIPTCSV